MVEKKTCGDFKESQQAETLDLKMLQAETKEKSGIIIPLKIAMEEKLKEIKSQIEILGL